MNKYIGECFRGSSSLQTSKNFTSDNECSQLHLSINFLGTQTLKVGHASYLILPTPICSPQAHACYLLNTHTTHPPTPPIPPTSQNTHSETDTNPQRQPKHKPTDGRVDTDRHQNFRHTHLAQTHNTHNTTTRQHDNVLTDKETETETDRQTDRQTRQDQTRSDRQNTTEQKEMCVRRCACDVCGDVWCDVM